jgi:type IV pilus assembly protein PilE
MTRRPVARARRASVGGVSLMELLIVITIVGVLAAIAIPVYRGYTQRTWRTEALNAMGQMQTRQENFRNVNHTYTADLDALGFPDGCTENCIYTVSFDLAPDTRSYTARLTPTPGGGWNDVDQTSDDRCQWFTVDAQGRRDAPDERCLRGR